MNARAQFTRMEHSTKEDWGLIVPEAMKMAKSLPDRVVRRLMATPRNSVYKAAIDQQAAPA
jgi:hypothetical protein